MNERIKELRKALDLNQTEFGNKIGVKQGTVTGYETGNRTPTDAVILSICREFNVSENWLRTGVGEMFVKRSRSEAIADFLADTLNDEEESYRRRLIEAISQLDEEDMEALMQVALRMVKK